MEQSEAVFWLPWPFQNAVRCPSFLMICWCAFLGILPPTPPPPLPCPLPFLRGPPQAPLYAEARAAGPHPGPKSFTEAGQNDARQLTTKEWGVHRPPPPAMRRPQDSRPDAPFRTMQTTSDADSVGLRPGGMRLGPGGGPAGGRPATFGAPRSAHRLLHQVPSTALQIMMPPLALPGT